MTGTHCDVPDGHQYYSSVDEPEHLDPGDIDPFGRCMYGIVSCIYARLT